VSGGLRNAGPGESESTSFVDKKGEPINMDFDRHHAIAPQERRQPFSKNVLQLLRSEKRRAKTVFALPRKRFQFRSMNYPRRPPLRPVCPWKWLYWS
jgi:hypothetical protein